MENKIVSNLQQHFRNSFRNKNPQIEFALQLEVQEDQNVKKFCEEIRPLRFETKFA